MDVQRYAASAAARVFADVVAQILEPERQPCGREETP